MKRELNCALPVGTFMRVSKVFAAEAILIMMLTACQTANAQQTWVAQAPGPNTRGQVENIDEGEVVGAIKAVAVHPTNADIVYVGAVNGGIWRTANGMAPHPTWQAQIDAQQSLSIGALEFDPTDAAAQTLVAGTGRFSSMGNEGGVRSGLLRTTDGGAHWTPISGGGALSDLNISGVAPRGATIVIAVNEAANGARRGIWRSTNTGATWTQISGGAGTGLPAGSSADLASDPTNLNRLFTNGGARGLFRSMDSGATWTKVSNAAMDTLVARAGNVKISVGRANNVYVAIVVGGELAGVFRSGDGGTNWSPMDLPSNAEGGIHPGGQGGTHLSIAADRDNNQLVYIGGDRQETGAANFPTPNSIGARDYSGRLFRGDASMPAGRQWVHLTHSRTLGAAGGGTAHNSAPHADSRDMAMAANGMLVETDDGGIYRRTSPQNNTGDWFSMNGNIQATEFHAIAWDANSNVVIGGSQDTGTPEQRLTSDVRWRSVSTGDGGVVAVDDLTTPGRSTRYSSYYNLFDFRRQVFDATNNFLSEDRPELRVLNGGDDPAVLFYTPIKLNAVTPKRLILGAANSVYESMDQGDTLKEIGPGIGVNETGANIIAYGATGNPDMLYVGSGSDVFVRNAADPAPLQQSAAYPGRDMVVSIAIDPNAPNTAYVIDAGRVFRTTNAGGAWAEITGDLPTLSPGSLRSVAYCTSTPAGFVVVGSNEGVFQAPGPAFSTWTRLGSGLPTAPVYHLEYDPADRVLLAGTLGRGAWTLTFPPSPGVPAALAPAAQEGSEGGPMRVGPPPQERGPKPPTAPAAPTPPNANPFQLRPGVVVDPVRRVAYIMNPDGAVEALDLGAGTQLWSTREAAKPLAVAGEKLVAQAEASDAGNALPLVVMESKSGEVVTKAVRGLPAGVKPSIVETVNGEFTAFAEAEGGNALVAWQYLKRHLRGMHPNTKDTISGTETEGVQSLSDEQSRSGAFRLNLSTGATSNVSGPGIPTIMSMQQKVLPAAERLPGLPETQVLSADERYILVSERVEDDRVWEKYKLTVYDRAGRAPVGEFRSHFSVVPFFVTDSTVVFERRPSIRRAEAGLVEESLALRAVDLKTGRELWTRPIRDTSFRGPFPP